MRKNVSKILEIVICLFLSAPAHAGWFDKKSEEKKAVAPPASTAKPTVKPALPVPAAPKRNPEEIKAFNARIQKERAEFEKKIGAMPPGPKETLQADFSKKMSQERAALEKEIAAMPPDEKETLQKEFQREIQERQKAFYAKLKSMPPTAKEQKRKEFEERMNAERKALNDKLKSVPPDPKEAARREFEDSLRKKTQEFYSPK